MKKKIVLILTIFLLNILIQGVVASCGNNFGTVENSIRYKDQNDKNNQEIVSCSDSWQQINKDGFGNEFNSALRGSVVFNDSLLVGITNADWHNGSLAMLIDKPISIKQLLIWYLSTKGDIKAFEYNGCEIWSYDKNGWRAIVGDYPDSMMPAGFGNKNNTECSALIVYKDYLYVGVWNDKGCQVWRTNDLKNWEQVVFEGFGNKDNICAMTALIFRNELYFGTTNWNGTEIYRTNDGLNWTAVVGGSSSTEPAFGVKYRPGVYTWSMCEYNSHLYVGTANAKGLEIWKSNDGEKWEPVIAYDNIFEAKKHGADYPRGFGKYWAGCARNMIVFKNELYVMCSIRGYMRIVLQAFGKKLFDFSLAMPTDVLRYPLFNLVPRSGQIWKYNASNEKWSRVVGGWGKNNNSAGFGDRLNQYLWSVSVFNEHLYVGTLHNDPHVIRLNREGLFNWTVGTDIVCGKAELWRTSDGENWEKAINDGFGDNYNFGIRELEVYKNKLYAFTTNMNTGCEVWRYDLNEI